MRCLFYHSVSGKAVMGIAQVSCGKRIRIRRRKRAIGARSIWPRRKPCADAVTLEEIKRNPKLKEMALLGCRGCRFNR